jgi:hypothetical protein
VLLQALEYFNGIIFLTTTRPGLLDEAVKSRVHACITYKELTLEQTLAIFSENIERLRASDKQHSAVTGAPEMYIFDDEILDFARTNYKPPGGKNTLGRWNGRQITNAFTLAGSLVRARVAGKPSAQPQMRRSDFETVAALILAYDISRAKALKKTDASIAHSNEERWDATDDPTTLYSSSSSRERVTFNKGPPDSLLKDRDDEYRIAPQNLQADQPFGPSPYLSNRRAIYVDAPDYSPYRQVQGGEAKDTAQWNSQSGF